MLHTKYESFGPCGFGEEDFYKVFPMTPPGRGPYGPQGHGWQDSEWILGFCQDGPTPPSHSQKGANVESSRVPF